MESLRHQLQKLPSPAGKDISNFEEVLEENMEKARKRNENLGEGLKVGKVVNFPVADGYSWYEIEEIGDKVSRVGYLPELCVDNYQAKEVDSDGYILTSNLKQAVNQVDGKFSNL